MSKPDDTSAMTQKIRQNMRACLWNIEAAEEIMGRTPAPKARGGD